MSAAFDACDSVYVYMKWRRPSCSSQVLVEFDNADWKRREWIRVYEDPFAAFLVEETLTWHVRNSNEPPSPALVSGFAFYIRVHVPGG
ncbi:hypothetical protein HPB50_020724 [Hyalomma asiaticum]|uniref:Uncharacterized protein n=1 Tax=Hyalomma asiaticum TaxID=266040 RepID=A0ACB7TKV1_HYAAI|nr:hypothetical protein HPB50_020724 [Hyalomma asiaticum]